jgi:hypothetical protein
MKMIRNYLKKLIVEAILESFPPMHINIEDLQDSIKKLELKNCVFRDSKIRIGNIKNKELDCNHCVFDFKEGPVIADLDEEDKAEA